MKNNLEEKSLLTPEEKYLEKELIANLREQMGSLKQIEQDVLKKRFGIEKHEPYTLLQIGTEKGLTKERIRQIEKEAIEALRSNPILSSLRPYQVA